MSKKIILKIHPYQKESFNLKKKLPTEPGIYFFLSEKGRVLYVGKSRNLKNRVLSYFSKLTRGKTKDMVKKAQTLSFIKTGSEIEALILEANLIKKYQPKYNLIQKDDKTPLYIVITDEKYPRVILQRKSNLKKEKIISFYGPFLSTQTARKLLRDIRKFIPFSDHKIGKKPCFYHQIGACDPCPNLIEQIKDSEEKKKAFKRYRRNIKNIRYFLEGKTKKVETELLKQIKELAAQEQFESALKIREKLERFHLLTQPIRKPQDYLENPNLIEETRKEELASLLKFLRKFFKIKKLVRIECYDISHLSGISAAASMVVFKNGEKSPADYRRFKIKKSSADDLKSLEEVIKRRLLHLDDWGRPDLIIVDGGKPQVLTFQKILKDYNLPVVGIAKRFEKLIIPYSPNVFISISLKDKPFGNLVIRIRDESHRFAQKYHHFLILNR